MKSSLSSLASLYYWTCATAFTLIFDKTDIVSVLLKDMHAHIIYIHFHDDDDDDHECKLAIRSVLPACEIGICFGLSQYWDPGCLLCHTHDDDDDDDYDDYDDDYDDDDDGDD